jgi:hypothetical protein
MVEKGVLWTWTSPEAVKFRLGLIPCLFIFYWFHVFSPQTTDNPLHTLNIDARKANTREPHKLLLCQHNLIGKLMAASEANIVG